MESLLIYQPCDATSTLTSTPTFTSNPTITPTPVTGIFSNGTFTYNGNGRSAKSVINGVTTYFVGTHYLVTGSTVTKYYYAGTQRIAMRKNGTLSFILSDHLGSTSLVTDSLGNVINQTQYKAWGETRYTSGTAQTKYTYTGQYSYVSDFGLHFYNARWYDSSLGRFAQADTIVPGGGQGFDRYAYTNNNPINYTDPSGHDPWWCGESQNPGNCMANWFQNNTNTSTFLFSGTYGPGTENNPGPGASENYGLPIWNDDTVNPIQYPGSEYDRNGNLVTTAKYKQSINARGIADTAAAILICYSGGTESCLMHAKWRIDNGYPVASVVLLGPTFIANNESQNLLEFGQPDNDDILDDWADYIQFIDKNSNASILVVNDGNNSATAASPQNCPGCAGILNYMSNNLIHYGINDAGNSATNTSAQLKEDIYNIIFNNAWD